MECADSRPLIVAIFPMAPLLVVFAGSISATCLNSVVN